ncbi:MAG: conserved membrane protein of unknown function [Candidatus Thorarchaeota archaeon]|nr:MAG: conserved membrane protein of unknown function [Candidatus Thorarchaeota archaeon]
MMDESYTEIKDQFHAIRNWIDMMQNLTTGLIRLDLLLEVISGIIALVIAHYADKAFMITRQKKLSDLSTGFLVLSAGMFGRVIGTLYFFVILDLQGGNASFELQLMVRVVTIAYGALKIMAYILFALSTRRPKQSSIDSEMMLLAPLPFLVDTNLELIATFVLLVVVLQAVMNYGRSRNRFALYVLAGFFFVFVSHIFGIFTLVEPSGYLISQVFQFLGLIAFLVLLYRVGQIE